MSQKHPNRPSSWFGTFEIIHPSLGMATSSKAAKGLVQKKKTEALGSLRGAGARPTGWTTDPSEASGMSLASAYGEACGGPAEDVQNGLRVAKTLRVAVTTAEGDKALARFFEDQRCRLALESAIVYRPGAKAVEANAEKRSAARLFRGMGTALAVGAALESLELAGCGLSATQAACLGRGMATSRLRLLSMRRVPLGEEGLEALAPGLRACSCVYISLRGCRIPDASGRQLASIVREHGARRDQVAWAQALRKGLLDQKSIPTEDDEARSLARHAGILVLDVADNALGDDAAKALADAADDWLVGVHLGGNENVVECGDVVRQAAVRRPQCAWRLEGTKIAAECQEDIDRARRPSACAGAERVVSAWSAAPAYGLSLDTAKRLLEGETAPDVLSRLVIDVLCDRGRAHSPGDLDKALLKARVACQSTAKRAATARAAEAALASEEEHVDASSRGATLAARRSALATIVGSEEMADVLVSSGRALSELAADAEGYYGDPSEEARRACDRLHRVLRERHMRPRDLYAALKSPEGGLSAAELSEWLARAAPRGAARERTVEVSDEKEDLAALIFRLAGSPELLEPASLEAALNAVKRRGRRASTEARGALVLRRLVSAIEDRDDPREFLGRLGPRVTLEALSSVVSSLLDTGKAEGVAAAARILAFARREDEVEEVDVDDLLSALERRSDSALASVAHARAVLELDELRAESKWTTTAVCKQAQSLWASKHGEKSRDVVALAVDELRLALDEWRIASAEPPDLADDAVLARAATSLSTPKRKPESDREDNDREEAEDDDEEITLRDMLSFARRVATVDGRFVDGGKLDSAIRAYRRGAAGVAKLQQAALNLKALRDDLSARDVDLAAWLEAAAAVRRGDLDPDALKTGLVSLLAGSGEDRHAYAPLVEAALDALDLFSERDPDLSIVDKYVQADARARAVSSKAGVPDQDLAAFLSASELMHSKLVRKLDRLLAVNKWRVHDILDRLAPFDDHVSPRALCRAFQAWGLFAPTDKHQQADFDRIVGSIHNAAQADAKTPVLDRHPKRNKRTHRSAKKRPNNTRTPEPLRRVGQVRAKSAASQSKTNNATSARAKKNRRQRQPNDDEILAALENAVLSIAARVSHIESLLDTDEVA